MRKIHVYRINTGSCNACDVELLTSALVSKFGFQELGYEMTNDPSSAHIILVTGPVTARTKDYFARTLQLLPKKKIVISVGICAISCGVFRDSYSIVGPVDKYVDVDLNVPGCPPSPKAILESLIVAKSMFEKKEV